MSSSTITINVYVGSDGVTVGQGENVSTLPTNSDSEPPGPLTSGAPEVGMVENQVGAPAPTESGSATVVAVSVDAPIPDEAVVAKFDDLMIDNTDAPAPGEITSE